MTREITHMKAFTAALESLNKPRFSIGQIPPTAGLVDQFFNDSTGEGQDGEIDARGPWNQGAAWQLIEGPAFQDAGVNPRKLRRSRVLTIGRRTRPENRK
jgi:Mn-containing catalase